MYKRQSLAIARSYVGRSGYTLVENQTNTGFSAAVNTGIGLAKGEYVVQMCIRDRAMSPRHLKSSNPSARATTI